jgi:hypothetical protein
MEGPRKGVSDTTCKEWQQEREIEIGVGKKKELRDEEEQRIRRRSSSIRRKSRIWLLQCCVSLPLGALS